MSLRLRVFVLTLIVFTAGLVAAGFAVPSLVRGFLVERVDEKLAGTGVLAIGELRGLPDGGVGGGGGGDILERDGAYARVYADGEVVVDDFLDPQGGDQQVPDLPDDVTALEPGVPMTVAGTGPGRPTDYRVQVIDPPTTDLAPALQEQMAGVTVVVALPLTEVDESIDRIVRIELTVGAIVLVVVGAALWWLIGVGLRPLRQMEATAESIRTGGFDGDGRTRRISHPATRTELGQLGATLNAMLDSIDDAFARQGASEARLRRFVADASHELRTPLTSIRGYAQLAGRQDDDPAGRRAGLARIESESVRMTRLVEDLLLLARLDEQPEIRTEPVELTALVTQLAADAQAADPARRVRVDARAPVVVDADRAALSQAVLNLLANASAHTPAGSPIEVGVHVDADRVRVDVVDHGPGVPDDAKAMVFDRFARVDHGRHRGAGGAGLGLAIVASIAAAHGGRVQVDDTPGGGATFSIVLPGATRAA